MGGIFISYRREDSAGHAGRIYDRLRERFGREKVFMDVAGIEPGVDFVEAIDRAVSSCDALLVIIGSKWVSCTDASGNRRLDDPQDFIRLETATALKRGIRVIPVLVQKATMPTESDLPNDLKMLARRQATEIDDTHWDSDTEQLIETLAKLLHGELKTLPSDAQQQVPPQEEKPTPSPALTTVPGKNRLIWIISTIAAVVVALGGLLSTIESYRDTFSRFFGSGQKTVQEAPVERPAPQPEPEPKPEQPRPMPERSVSPERPKPVKQSVMPKLVGEPLEKALELVGKAGLRAGEPRRVETADSPEGTVVEQSPKAGTRLAREEKVELVVAVPPREPEMVEVPDVTGQLVKEAATTLKEAGLIVESRRSETGRAEPGTVIRQSLRPGSRVRPGETISLVYAVAPRDRGEVGTREAVLPAPVQTWPEDGMRFDNFPRTMAVRWEPVRSAASYTVEIDCLHCCESGKWCSDLGKPWKVARDIPVVRSPGYKFEFAGAQPGRWRVWAVDERGRGGEKSPWRVFRYTK